MGGEEPESAHQQNNQNKLAQFHSSLNLQTFLIRIRLRYAQFQSKAQGSQPVFLFYSNDTVLRRFVALRLQALAKAP